MSKSLVGPLKAHLFPLQYQGSTGFYQSDYESGRAYEFLKWMTENIHHNSTLRNVGAFELVNEPLREDSGNTRWMVEHYYPSAIDAIRGVENELGIDDAHRLNIIMMDDLWASGPEATSSLSATQKQHLLFDDHNYQGSPIDNCGGAKSCAISYTCSSKSGQGNRVTAQSPKVVGEWSMKLNQLGGQELQNKDFFKQYFAAQQQQYEKTLGWIYWSWKTEHFSDYLQWSYKGKHCDGPNGGINLLMRIQMLLSRESSTKTSMPCCAIVPAKLQQT